LPRFHSIGGEQFARDGQPDVDAGRGRQLPIQVFPQRLSVVQEQTLWIGTLSEIGLGLIRCQSVQNQPIDASSAADGSACRSWSQALSRVGRWA
jgi:hypothetical protein